MSDEIRKQLDEILANAPGEEVPPEMLSKIVGGFNSGDDTIGGEGNGDGANLNHHLSDGPYSKAWGRST